MDSTRSDAPPRPRQAEQPAVEYSPSDEGARGPRAGRSRSQEGGRMRGFQSQVSELLSVRSMEDLEQRVKANPLASMAVAAGIGLLLQRTAGMGGDDEAGELTPAEERLVAWLNDAYALERAQIPILKNHAKDARRHPRVRRKDLEHLEATRQHAKLVKRCIAMLGRKPSKAKAAAGRISGSIMSLTTAPFQDELVRNFLADYASESLEIASYQAIITAAESLGHLEIARICEEILADEEEMAEWLRTNLSRAVRSTLEDLELGGPE